MAWVAMVMTSGLVPSPGSSRPSQVRASCTACSGSFSSTQRIPAPARARLSMYLDCATVGSGSVLIRGMAITTRIFNCLIVCSRCPRTRSPAAFVKSGELPGLPRALPLGERSAKRTKRAGPLTDKTKTRNHRFRAFWRKDGDSNPRTLLTRYTISSRAP